MNTKTQLWIDKNLVKPFVSTTNILVRFVGFLLRLDHNLEKDFSTIAVCKYKGLGSIVQASALLQSLRESYPNAKIVFVSTVSNAPLLKKIDCIDEIVLLNDKSASKLIFSYPGFIFKLIGLRIGVFIDLEIYSNFSSLTTTLSLARNRLGFYLRASHYRMGIYTHMMYYNTRVPIMQTYLQMVRLLKANAIIEKLYPLKSNESPKVKGEYIVVNPNASDLRIERRWPLENFKLLIEKLRIKYPKQKIVLVGAPNEAEYVAKLHSYFKDDKIINTAGKTSFEQLIALIQNAEFVITNDTGPMHLAAACGVRTIALFGPCSPNQYGAINNVIPVYQNLYCSPCVHEFDVPPCLGDNQCMKQIQVETVITALDKPTREKPIKPEFKGGEDALGFVKRKA
ncbi:MAG: glycosyltransferase family 9 protein [Bacteroidia bacterium]